MTICARNHPEIVFEDWDCPICRLVKEHDLFIYRLEEKAETQIAEMKEDRDYYLELLQINNPELFI